MNTNNEQNAVISYNNNMLVLASAGTGKTFCITQKVKYLKEYCHAKNDDFLIISFTNESVNDIKRKINLENVYTFHKLSLKILNNNYSLCSDNLLNDIIGEFFYSFINNKEKFKLLLYYFDFSYDHFLKTDYFFSLKKLIFSFISIMKANNYNFDYLKKIFVSSKDNFFITIIMKIYKIYEIEKMSQNKIDLNDLIIEAAKVKKRYKYKYIFIDEFQDTSLIRFNLILNILQNSNAKIFLFGDDYQSIYHFTGCDLNIMLNINKYIPNIKTFTLRQTYRNSQELISIASTFVNKNPSQIKKDMFSLKSLKTPIKIIYYSNAKKAFEKLVKSLDMDKTLIIGRNNNDLSQYTNKSYRYLTIHKSKGLEEDNIIIINMNNDIYGFPNKIKNHALIDNINPVKEIKYAEERRLFYVALTRARNYVYIMANKNNPSTFVKELFEIIKSYNY